MKISHLQYHLLSEALRNAQQLLNSIKLRPSIKGDDVQQMRLIEQSVQCLETARVGMKVPL